MDYTEITDGLRRNGYRLTEARRHVSRVLCNSGSFHGAYDIHRILKEQGFRVGLASVYRVLELLWSLNLVQKEEFGSGGEKFRLNRQNHSHQLICSGCGAAKEFSNCAMHGLEQNLEHSSGFKIHHHWLRFFGLCPNCQLK